MAVLECILSAFNTLLKSFSFDMVAANEWRYIQGLYMLVGIHPAWSYGNDAFFMEEQK